MKAHSTHHHESAKERKRREAEKKKRAAARAARKHESKLERAHRLQAAKNKKQAHKTGHKAIARMHQAVRKRTNRKNTHVHTAVFGRRTRRGLLSNFKLGRLPKQRPEGLKALHEYGLLPMGPTVFGSEVEAVYDWQMLGNDQYGDCEFAGFVHGNMAVTLLEDRVPPPITDQDVVDAYLHFTGGEDTGCVTSQVLAALFDGGLCGVEVDAYAPIDGGIPEVLNAVAAFGTVAMGVNLPLNAQEQFPSRIWTVSDVDDQIEGGHCIYATGYDMIARTVNVVTWGQQIKATFEWLDKYLDEAWAVLFNPVKVTGALNGIDFTQLLADLDSLADARAEAA